MSLQRRRQEVNMQLPDETPAQLIRRKALGAAMGGLGFKATADTLWSRGRLHLDGFAGVVPGLDEAARLPTTVPSIHAQNYLQAHRLDTGFCDKPFGSGANLETHARHDRNRG
jgi:hypothetical protein